MFCPKCGSEIKELAKFCGVCGCNITDTRDRAEKQSNSDSVKIYNFSEADSPKLREAPSRIPEQREEPFNPYDYPRSSPNAYPESVPEPETRQEKQKGKGGLIAALVILSALIVAGAVAGILYLTYENSDSRKAEKTVEYILNGKMASARQLLDTYDADNESTLRAYLDVLDKRDTFVSRFDVNTCVQIDRSSVIDARDDFKLSLESFRKNGNPSKLPEKLYEQCEYYYTKLCETDEFAERLVRDFNDSQKVFLNEVYCNRNDTFTLRYIQTNVDLSNAGLSSLMKKIRSAPVDWSDESNTETTALRRLMTDFEKAVKKEIELCEADIKKNLQSGYTMDSELYRKNPDPEYASYICGDLGKVESEDDIEDNTLIFRNTLICSLSASAIAAFN